MKISFTIPGPPQGKGRPRFARRRSGMVAYTPDETRMSERTIATLAKAAMQGRKPFSGPVIVNITAIFPVPESWSKKKKQDALDQKVFPTVKPDRDNIDKLICDSLNGVAFADDKQAVDGGVSKIYGPEPCVLVTVGPKIPPS